MANLANKPLIGPQGRVYVDTDPWHSTLTSVELDPGINVETYKTLGGDNITKAIRASSSPSVTLDSLHFTNDPLRDTVVDNWTDGSMHRLFISQKGMRVGDEVDILQVSASGGAVTIPGESFSRTALSGSLVGDAFHGIWRSGDFSSGQNVFSKGDSDLTERTYDGSNSNVIIHDSAFTRDADATKLVLLTAVRGVSGVTSGSRFRIMATDASGTQTAVAQVPYRSLTSTVKQEFFVLDMPAAHFDQLSVEVSLGALTPPDTEYDLNIRTAISYITV